MSAITIAGDTSGSITLDAPAVAGTTVLTLPATSGTVMVNGPAFSAYRNSTQSISNNVDTKIAFNAEFFDTNNNFDATTNYRFTPTVAGYYQLNLSIWINVPSLNTGITLTTLYKNGSAFLYGGYKLNGNFGEISTNTWLVYANGTTDYFECYILQSTGSSQNLNGGTSAPYGVVFSGSMVRGA